MGSAAQDMADVACGRLDASIVSVRRSPCLDAG